MPSEIKCDGGCGRMIKPSLIEFGDKSYKLPSYCPDCLKIREAQEAENEVKKENDQWIKICPPRYLDATAAKLSANTGVNIEVYNQIISHKYSPEGLLLWGESGVGKTVSMWLLMKKFFDEGRKIKCFDSRFSNWLGYLYKTDSANAYLEMEKVYRCDVLFLDELSQKGRVSERLETELFNIVDYREKWLLPIFATDNLNSAGITDKLSSNELAEAFLNRVKRTCRIIKVKRDV